MTAAVGAITDRRESVPMFEATVLIDNLADGDLTSEWGLCVCVEYGGKRYLLDTGSSDRYLENAEKLHIDISSVDAAVLSHAHFDHSGGYRSFFEVNRKAPLYLASSCPEDCWFKIGPIRKRIGIPHGILDGHSERIERVSGFRRIDEGVYLIPHLENGLETIGKKAHLYRSLEGRAVPDNFSHEQSLVFETEKGLIVLNSCSHGGLQNILNDVSRFLPGKSVYMTIGGLHLSGAGTRSVRSVAAVIRELSIERIVTGHCTGQKAYRILKEELGGRIQQLHVGMKIRV